MLNICSSHGLNVKSTLRNCTILSNLNAERLAVHEIACFNWQIKTISNMTVFLIRSCLHVWTMCYFNWLWKDIVLVKFLLDDPFNLILVPAINFKQLTIIYMSTICLNNCFPIKIHVILLYFVIIDNTIELLFFLSF